MLKLNPVMLKLGNLGLTLHGLCCGGGAPGAYTCTLNHSRSQDRQHERQNTVRRRSREVCPCGRALSSADDVWLVMRLSFITSKPYSDSICHGFGIRIATAVLLTATVSAKARFFLCRAYFSSYRTNCRLPSASEGSLRVFKTFSGEYHGGSIKQWCQVGGCFTRHTPRLLSRVGTGPKRGHSLAKRKQPCRAGGQSAPGAQEGSLWPAL